MKTILILFTLSLFLQAEIKLTDRVFTADKTETALAQAVKEGKPISFLITDTSTHCPKCNRVSQKMMSVLDQKTTMVCAKQRKQLPYEAFKLIKDVDRGKYIPFLYVFTNDLNTFLGIVRYNEVKVDPENAFNAVLTKIKALEKGS